MVFNTAFVQSSPFLYDIKKNQLNQDFWTKTKKADPHLKWWTPQALQASPHGGQDIENSLSETRAELRQWPRKESYNPFIKKKFFFFFKIHGFYPQTYRSGGRRQEWPLDGAVDFL